MRIINFAVLTILLLTTCQQMKNDKLLIVRDTDYIEPAYRFDIVSKGDSLFSLHERYFVLGYKKHKDKFEEAALALACKRLNDSLQISRYEIDFQDTGMRSGGHEEGDNYSVVFSEPITYFVWYRARPDSIVINRKKDNYFVQELNPFACDLVPKD